MRKVPRLLGTAKTLNSTLGLQLKIYDTGTIPNIAQSLTPDFRTLYHSDALCPIPRYTAAVPGITDEIPLFDRQWDQSSDLYILILAGFLFTTNRRKHFRLPYKLITFTDLLVRFTLTPPPTQGFLIPPTSQILHHVSCFWSGQRGCVK